MFLKIKEAPLAFNTSHGSLHWDHMPKALKAHLGVKDTWESQGPYVSTVFPEHVVYTHGGETFKQKYSIKHGAAGSDPAITFLGNKKKVHTAYVDSADQAQESMRFLTDGFVAIQNDPRGETQSVVTTLSEGDVLIHEGIILDFDKAKEADSALPKPIEVKLISAGWGSSGYYPKEVLQRDGPGVYAKGTHMYWNHATEAQEQDRPEGDLSDLAAVLTENAVWKEDGAKGPGLYSKAKVFSDYATQVAEKGPHIGVSINTYVKGKEGEAEGRTGRIVEKLIKTNMNSVDFVTRAGAGGAPIVHAQESDRVQLGKEQTVTEAEIKAMQDRQKVLESENAQLKESQFQTLAVAAVGSILQEADIPFNVKLVSRACAHPVVKEGKLDEAWVKSVVDDFSDGFEGHVTGMGHQQESADAGKGRERVTQADVDKKLKEAYKDLGVPEAGLAIAVNFGRN